MCHPSFNLVRQFCYAAILGAAALEARSDSITLIPVADTAIFERAPFNNLGAVRTVAVGNTATVQPARSLVKFGVASALPTDVTISSARLELTVVKTLVAIPTTFIVHRLLVDWGEGDKGAGLEIGTGAAATSGEASWIARLHPTTLWSVPGGEAGTDYAAEPSAAGELASESTLTFESTPQLVADIQAWLDNPASNFGWIIKTQTESDEQTARRFGSREHPSSPLRLFLEYGQARPRITGTEVNGGQFCFHFTARAGKEYVVERRDQVDTGTWTAITNLPPATTTEDVVICEPLGSGNQFYRVGEQ